MHSLFLGLGAALLWGVHDFTIRKISGRAPVAVLLGVVLGAGALLLAPFAALAGGWAILTPQTVGLALVSGACYGLACYGHYRAFAIGPVRLVAPICGAYPMVSVGFAVARGQEASALIWLGALAVVSGVALVARGKDGAGNGPSFAAIGWALLAATAFAATFGLAQWAAEAGAELPVSLIARVAAFVAVLAFVILRRSPVHQALPLWPYLVLMAVLDVGALVLITLAAGYANPAVAPVAASIFGLVTILLAWRLLAEPMTALQWGGVVTVFGGIILLGLA